MTDFGKKNWFSSFATYFFTWVIILIILINPPIYDDEAPRIDTAILPDMQELGGTVNIIAKITDNAGLTKENIQFSITNPDGKTFSPDFDYQKNIFNYVFPSPLNLTSDRDVYNFKIIVKDNSNRETLFESSFLYTNDTINLALPQSGSTVYAASDIKFDVKANVNRVFYTVNDGNQINTTKSSETNYYITSPKIKGWIKDENVTIRVFAEVVYYFENNIQNGQFVKYNNTIIDNAKYDFFVEKESDIGTLDSPVTSMPGPRYVAVPGFELIIVIISFIVVLTLTYKKKSNQK